MNKDFKPGDKVRCVDNTDYKKLIQNEIYIIDSIYGNFVSLVGDLNLYYFLSTRFKPDVKLMRKFKLEQLKNEL